jgi:hypothetical protein
MGRTCSTDESRNLMGNRDEKIPLGRHERIILNWILER